MDAYKAKAFSIVRKTFLLTILVLLLASARVVSAQLQNFPGGSGTGTGALTLPTMDAAGLIGEYLMADGGATQFLDSSAAGNNGLFAGGGCVNAPTALGAPSFGYSFTAGSSQCGGTNSALNASRTVMIAFKHSASGETQNTPVLFWGSITSNFSGLALAEALNFSRTTTSSAINGTANGDLNNSSLDGTLIVTFVCGASDHVYLSANGQTVEPAYFNQLSGCVAMSGAGGQIYDLGGSPANTGAGAFVNYFTGTMYAAVFWNTAKTLAQVTAQANALEQYLRTARGIVLNTNSTYSAAAAFDCLGDSLSIGSGATSYCGAGTGNIMTLPANAGTWTSFNHGQNGATATGCASAMPFDVQSNLPATAAPRVRHIWLATNDIVVLGLTAAQTWAAYQQCAANVKRLDPGSLVSIATIVSRTTLSDVTRDAVNSSIRAGWQGIADMMVDFAEDPLLGADGLAGVSACFQGDAIHPNQACQYNNLTPMMQRSVNSRLGCLNFSCATTYASGAPAATAVTATSESTNTMTFTTTLNPPVGSSVVCTGITPAGYNSPAQGWYVLTTAAGNFTAFNNTTGLGVGTVFGVCSVPQEKDGDVYAILNNTGSHTLLSCVGRTWPIVRKNINAGAVTITTWGSELINGAATYVLPANASVTLYPTLVSAGAAGCNWRTLP